MKVIESWERHHLPFITWKELRLLPNETLKEFMITFSDEIPIFPWVKPVLAAGDTDHLIDAETGLDMPYTVPSGYELKIIRFWASVDRPIRGRMYVDTALVNNVFYRAGGVYFEQEIQEFTTEWIDPAFASSHILDFQGYNADPVGDAYGTVIITATLIDHGSDPAFERETKRVKCPICDDIKTVPYTTTRVKCSNGHDFMVKCFPWGGRL